jgi:hypothetical protein
MVLEGGDLSKRGELQDGFVAVKTESCMNQSINLYVTYWRCETSSFKYAVTRFLFSIERVYVKF